MNKFLIYSSILFLLIPIYVIGCWELYKYTKKQWDNQSDFDKPPVWVYWVLLAVFMCFAISILGTLMMYQDMYSLLGLRQGVLGGLPPS